MVSFIIPTYNAGRDFIGVLKLLRDQEDIGEKELVIVDSGSTDETVDIAKQFGAKLIQIPNEEFSHSQARNLGVQYAQGKYLFMMTQDAFPTDFRWAHRILDPLIKGIAVAVSPEQIPKKNAPLFEKISIFNYNKTINPDRKDQVTSRLNNHDPISLQLNSRFVNNVTCAIHRDIISRYKYFGVFAEDLDLGMRLIQDGYHLALLYSVKVIHSHDRPPLNTLKRSLASTLHVKIQERARLYDISSLCAKLVNGYRQILFLRQKISSWGITEMTFSELQLRFEDLLESPAIIELGDDIPLRLNPSGDDQIDVILETFRFIQESFKAAGIGMKSNIIRYFEHIVSYYKSNDKVNISQNDLKDIANCMIYFYADTAGRLIGLYLLQHRDKDKIHEIANQLHGGV